MNEIELVYRKFKSLVKLNKIYITFAVGITTAAGYVLKKQHFDANMFWVMFGIFMLACSSSVINHIQESSSDSMMERTKARPIPSGEISKSSALWMVSLEFIAGAMILYLFSGWLALILGLTAFAWYNLVYTYLKKFTALAVIPGSIIGAIPPLVGWVAAGGSLLDPYAMLLAVFFFIWQIPHFWMLAVQFTNDYKKAGFPVLTDLFSKTQINRQIFVMVIITAVLASIIAFSGLITSSISSGLILVLSIGLVFLFSKWLNQGKNIIKRMHFQFINYYVLIVVILFCIDHLI